MLSYTNLLCRHLSNANEDYEIHMLSFDELIRNVHCKPKVRNWCPFKKGRIEVIVRARAKDLYFRHQSNYSIHGFHIIVASYVKHMKQNVKTIDENNSYGMLTKFMVRPRTLRCYKSKDEALPKWVLTGTINQKSSLIPYVFSSSSLFQVRRNVPKESLDREIFVNGSKWNSFFNIFDSGSWICEIGSVGFVRPLSPLDRSILSRWDRIRRTRSL